MTGRFGTTDGRQAVIRTCNAWEVAELGERFEQEECGLFGEDGFDKTILVRRSI